MSRTSFLIPLLLATAAMTLPDRVASAAAPTADAPRVIAHRGASARMPEHTLAAYRRAVEDGADFIEPDLVMTRDGVLVARHENEIGGTTDVALYPQFADRKRTQRIDGVDVTGWFTEDFTLAELKTLRAREPLPALRGIWFDRQFAVPTLHEIMVLLDDLVRESGRPVGLIPEIKHPTYFREIGLPMEQALLDVLATHEIATRVPLVVQSFEPTSLRTLGGLTAPVLPDLRLLQLIGDPRARPADVDAAGGDLRYRDMLTADGLRAIAEYASMLGPHKSQVGEVGRGGRFEATTLIADAHAAGLQVMPYTFRPENPYLPSALRSGGGHARNETGAIAEMRMYLDAGVDGLFADDPALARRAVDAR
ncbi:glycerophosphodiester phosphodiesterase family protein [Luteimonas sp. 3794]|uniref:glycerophosphodiester phosphodiesterase family protein n=1 Tax=Luteimonas sp. 3794 TaxID=2817730 RepID=UPI00285AC5CB|nr:glycerophosphodiester phosphodiesterase family protein [Luteimonas sp. 3794]MDR6990605.1 glycerophosphoryl diester phosphodiesterase [Luteimonas sp. 3794]